MIACAIVIWTSAAIAADPSDPNAPAAQALFSEGRSLMNENRYEEACAKLSESFRLVEASGTLLNLGLCHERIGKLASAYAELGESLSRAIKESRPEREKLAREHLAALEGRLSRVTVVVRREVELDGIEIKLDGALLRRPAWGVKTPIDRGAHVIETSAPGRTTFKQILVVSEDGESHEIVIPMLGAARRAEPVVLEAPSPRHAEQEPSPREEQRWSTQRWVGLVAGAGGVVAAGIGTGLALSASSKWGDAKSRCAALTCGSSADKSLGDDAGSMADLATVFFVIGGAMVAGGATLFFTAPAKRRGLQVTPVARDGFGGMTLRGTL